MMEVGQQKIRVDDMSYRPIVVKDRIEPMQHDIFKS
jgi:hypothetical protein